jgi:hypothetical protein
VAIFDCATCHNLKLSLMDDGDQYFKNKIKLCLNFFIVPCVRYLMNGWWSMLLAWHHECNYNGVA